MSKRKQTPDVLAEILNGGPAEGGSVNFASLEEPKRPARRPAAQAAEAPQTWEYCVVTFQDYRGWRPRYYNGGEIKDWTSGPLLHAYLQEMGENGWELAAASGGERMYGSADHHQLYFKRPL